MAKYVFVKGAKAAVVWNPETNRALAEFIRGEFSTNSSSVAKTLRDMGYKQKREFPDGPPAGGFPPEPTAADHINAGDPDVDIRAAKTETQALLKGQTEPTKVKAKTAKTKKKTVASKKRKSVTVKKRAK